MKLTNKITINTLSGSIQELDTLDLIVIDHNSTKTVLCYIDPYPTPLILWQDKEYDLAADYTQSDIENRILQIFGDNPSIIIQGLMVSKVQNTSIIPR